jgi:hypothetical protein
MNDKVIKAFSTDVSVEEGERAVTAKISTIAVDRDGEVLIPRGMNCVDYQKNPIVFLAHNYWDLPVGKCVAITRDEKSITAKTVFAKRPDDYPASESWMPDVLLDLFKQGVLKGFSVGFSVPEGGSRPATDKDIETYGPSCRRVYTRWNMLEYSVAPLPANQEAVALAVSKTWKEKDAKDKEPLYGSGGFKTAEEAAEYINRGVMTPNEARAAAIEVTAAPKRVVHYRRKAVLTPAIDPSIIIARAIEKRKGFIYSRI